MSLCMCVCDGGAADWRAGSEQAPTFVLLDAASTCWPPERSHILVVSYMVPPSALAVPRVHVMVPMPMAGIFAPVMSV